MVILVNKHKKPEKKFNNHYQLYNTQFTQNTLCLNKDNLTENTEYLENILLSNFGLHLFLTVFTIINLLNLKFYWTYCPVIIIYITITIQMNYFTLSHSSHNVYHLYMHSNTCFFHKYQKLWLISYFNSWYVKPSWRLYLLRISYIADWQNHLYIVM